MAMRTCQGFMVIVALVLAGPALQAQGLTANSAISVNGEAELRVAPDEAVLSLGIETFDRDLGAAKLANDGRVTRAIAAARRASVLDEHMKTDYIYIAPRYANGDITRELLGYVVRKTIVVRLKALDKFEELLTAALQAGVTHVHSIDFQTSKLREHRDRARVLAVTAAREKAALLAKEAGRQVGTVTSIGESTYGFASSYGSWWDGRYGTATQNVVQSFGGSPMTSDSALAPGQIAIRVNVHMAFALQ